MGFPRFRDTAILGSLIPPSRTLRGCQDFTSGCLYGFAFYRKCHGAEKDIGGPLEGS